MLKRLVSLLSIVSPFMFSNAWADTMKEPSSFSINGGCPLVYENVKKKFVRNFQFKVEESDKNIIIPKEHPLLKEVNELCKKANSRKNGRVWVSSDDKKVSVYFDIDKKVIIEVLFSQFRI